METIDTGWPPPACAQLDRDERLVQSAIRGAKGDPAGCARPRAARGDRGRGGGAALLRRIIERRACLYGLLAVTLAASCRQADPKASGIRWPYSPRSLARCTTRASLRRSPATRDSAFASHDQHEVEAMEGLPIRSLVRRYGRVTGASGASSGRPGNSLRGMRTGSAPRSRRELTRQEAAADL